MRASVNRWVVASFLGFGAFAAGCATRDPSVDDPDSGTPVTGTPDSGNVTPTPDAGAADYTLTTIANAIANASSLHAVEIRDAVVIGQYHFGDPVQGTFYIQDATVGGAGIAVFKNKTDTLDFPVIGDIVTIKGHFSRFNGSLQVSTSTKFAQPLSLTITGHNAVVTGGAYPPAGSPIVAGSAADYAPTAASKHDEQVGQVLQFNSGVSVTKTSAIVSTAADGGTKTQGFEVTGGLVVDDTFVYFDCIKGLDGGVGALDLSHGIRGVWDRYQDFGAGSASSPAPSTPALFPMSCDDLTMAPQN